MQYGLSEEVIKGIQSVLRKYQKVEKTVLYGSRAKGNYRPNSDIDLTLFGNELDLATKFKIETDLDDLLLPYKIDLSVFHSIENLDLIDHINRRGARYIFKVLLSR